MKHTEETKKKISDTLKSKGIKPNVLPSREQCIENLKKAWLIPIWNKGKKVPQLIGNQHAKGHKPNKTSFKRGQRPWNWKGGISSRLRKLRESVEYKVWRMDVFQRDWFTCQMPGCGYKGKEIEAHHIVRIKDNEDLIIDVKNGITLCKKCHLKIRNKEKDYEELFRSIVKTK